MSMPGGFAISLLSGGRPMQLADPSLLKSQCLVDGAWVGEGIDAIRNPATGATIAKVPRFGEAEATRAIEAAERALPPWARTLPKQRAAALRRWFDLIIANRDDIALIMTSEQGKPLAEARGEVDYAADFIEWFGEEAKRIYGDTIPSLARATAHPRHQGSRSASARRSRPGTFPPR